MTSSSPPPHPSHPPRGRPRKKRAAVVTLLRIVLRMVRNLVVYGRPFPPPFVFRKEPPE